MSFTRLSLTFALCSETCQLVGLHLACPMWREGCSPRLLALRDWLPWHVWTQTSRHLKSGETLAAPGSGMDVVRAPVPGLPHLGPRKCLEGASLSGRTLLRVDHWMTLASVLPHPPSRTLCSGVQRKACGAASPPRTFGCRGAAHSQYGVWWGILSGGLCPACPCRGRPDPLRRTQPLAWGGRPFSS